MFMDVPYHTTLLQRSGDILIVQGVVSGNQIYLDQGTGHVVNNPSVVDQLEQLRIQHQHQQQTMLEDREDRDEGLPQCKIKRKRSKRHCQTTNNSKCKQQKCPSCPYISESKSQMNYHISLHKPTQYECSMCTFVCAKKQHLSSHMRTTHNSSHMRTTQISR